jgi:hypothetical protein
MRLRICTPWDWVRRFRLEAFRVVETRGGQSAVKWHAEIRDRMTESIRAVSGHVEIRWSHGRFGGAPEAKVYLDTAMSAVPGYEPLA